MVDLAGLGAAVQACQTMGLEVKRRFEVGLGDDRRCLAAPLCVSRTAPPVSLCLQVKLLKQTGPPETRGNWGLHFKMSPFKSLGSARIFSFF